MLLNYFLFIICFVLSSTISIAVIELLYQKYLHVKINDIIDSIFVSIYRGNTYDEIEAMSLYQKSRDFLYTIIWFMLLFIVDVIISLILLALFIFNIYLLF